jgi:hypothetical protein
MRRDKKKKMGCCGYDELAYKPPTTRPIFATNLNARPQQRGNPGGFGAGILFPIKNLEGRR